MSILNRIPPRVTAAVLASGLLTWCLLPGVRMQISTPTCVPLSPWLARFGIHLELVANSNLCDSGLADINPALAHANTLLVTMSAATLLAYLAGLATSIGLWALLRQLWRSARAWIRNLVTFPQLAPTPVRVGRAANAITFIAAPGSQEFWLSQRRRGPPLLLVH